MTWQDISHLHGKKFRRATGLHRSVFEEMLNCICNYKSAQRKHPTRGGVSKLSIENQLLMTVLYWREYRSQENMGLDFHISQSKVSRTITEIEDILIKSGSFSLPGKKVLRDANGGYEVIIVDVTETPTERPKKNKDVSIAVRKSDTH
jgi:Helix-turn-helix of DDE superfamily endonuclease